MPFRTLFACLLLCLSANALAYHSVYQGKLGWLPVTLVIERTNDYVTGIYYYERYHTPIRLKPTRNTDTYNFAMDELDSGGLPTARLHFQKADFSSRAQPLQGTWTAYASGKQLPFTLKLVADIGLQTPSPGAVLPQAASTERFYFQLPMDMDYAALETIQVMDKATGKLQQTLEVKVPGCRSKGIDTVQVRLQGGATQVLIPSSPYCLGKTFEWREASARFEVVN